MNVSLTPQLEELVQKESREWAVRFRQRSHARSLAPARRA